MTLPRPNLHTDELVSLDGSTRGDLGDVTFTMHDGRVSDSDAWRRPTVKVEVDVWPYDATAGLGTFWDENAQLRVEVQALGAEQLVVVSGNSAGLRSLARHLLTLAQESVPDGRHFDIDWYGGLESGSANLRIEIEK